MFRDLPKKEKTFSIDVKGETTYQQYTGEFTVRAILNMGQKHQVELQKTQLQADTKSPTRELAAISLILAELRVRIIKGPDWWKDSERGAFIDDENVLIEIYDKITEAENEWKKEVRGEVKEELVKQDPNSQTEKPTN